MNNPILLVLAMSIVTIILRFLPFIIYSNSNRTPEIVSYFGKVLPYAVIGMLVVYCLKDMNFNSLSGFVPHLIGSLTVVLTYLFKRNTLLSIISGTVVYMLLVQNLF